MAIATVRRAKNGWIVESLGTAHCEKPIGSEILVIDGAKERVAKEILEAVTKISNDDRGARR